MENDTLGNRMKNYEKESISLNGKACPVVIRLDGNSFHTWTKKAKLAKPFDDRFLYAMQETALALCSSIPGAVFGYTQSDEISIAIRCDQSEKSMPWFGNRLQKLCSISSSICSANFNVFAKKNLGDVPLAYFDSRVIYLPNMKEVINHFIWRQNDCIKNSIAALAQSMFSDKQLLHKHQDDQLSMMLEKGVDWGKLETHKKYGSFIHRKVEHAEYNGVPYERKSFYIDKEPLRFSENKNYIEEAYDF